MREIPTLVPDDAYNKTLLSHVHPPTWQNPTPQDRYHLVIIGAGTAGLVTAVVAGSLGAKVALIEKHLMGGDCLNVGCVPSKSIIRSGRAIADVRDAKRFGINVPEGATVDFAAVMERVRKIRADISGHDSAKRFSEEIGVDVFLGAAKFSGPDTVEVDGSTLCFKKAVIATGARAAAPPVPGLEDAGYLNNETVFSLVTQPKRLGVIGAGPIGCEMAQTFQRLGTEVHLFEMGPHILGREDGDAAKVVQDQFIADGVNLVLNAKLQRVERSSEGKILHYEQNGQEHKVEVDEILVGVGRAPNVEGIGLDVVGVKYDARKGVEVDEKLRTSNPKIFAAGDVCLKYKFTHTADAAAKIVVQNALFFGRLKASDMVVPWCTFTEPEIAHVGLYEHDAKTAGFEIETYRVPLKDNDRSLAEGDDEGFVKVHTKKGTDQIVGATIVARHAGEMISELTLAIVAKVGLRKLIGIIHPYPTQAEAIKATAGLYSRTRLTPTVKKIFKTFFRWTG